MRHKYWNSGENRRYPVLRFGTLSLVTDIECTSFYHKNWYTIEKWCVQWSTLYLLTRTVRFFFLFTRGLLSSSSDSPEPSSSSDDEFDPGSLVSTSDSAFFSSASSSIRPPPSSSSSSPDSSLQRSARYGQILISLFKNLVTFSQLLNTQIVMRSSILRLVKAALSFSPRP